MVTDRAMMADRPILALDTATRMPTLALATADGKLLGQRQWESQHRHGEQLLEQLNQLLAEIGVDRRELKGVVVGTGPGSFTGLRIGLATAKTIAYTLDVPIVGISTTHALALAAVSDDTGSADLAVALPAGATDRYVHRLVVDGGNVEEREGPRLVAGEDQFHEATTGATVVAVDLSAADLHPSAIDLGERAVAALAVSLVRLGTAALNAGQRDDVARLVPAYVALPRGIAKAAAEMTWSPDLR